MNLVKYFKTDISSIKTSTIILIIKTLIKLTHLQK